MHSSNVLSLWLATAEPSVSVFVMEDVVSVPVLSLKTLWLQTMLREPFNIGLYTESSSMKIAAFY